MKKWMGKSVHCAAIKQPRVRPVNRLEPPSTHMPSPAVPALRLRDLPHPVMAGLVSVIVNYGGTFILVFQAAKVAGPGRS